MALALGSSAHGRGSAAGREPLLDPSHCREHGEPHRSGQDGVNWDPGKAPRRLLPSLPGTGLRAGTGAALSCSDSDSDRRSAPAPGWDRVPPTHGTGLWSLPSPRHPRYRGPAPAGMLRDPPRAGPGAGCSRCLPFSPVVPVALTSLSAQPSTRVPASGGAGGTGGTGRMCECAGVAARELPPRLGLPGASTGTDPAPGRSAGRRRPGNRIALHDVVGDVPVSRPSRVAAATLPRYPVGPGTPLPKVFRAPKSSRSPTRRRRRAEAGGGSVGRFYRITALLHQNRAGTGTGRAPSGRAEPCDPSRPAPSAAPGNQGRAVPGGRRGRPGFPPGPRATG